MKKLLLLVFLIGLFSISCQNKPEMTPEERRVFKVDSVFNRLKHNVSINSNSNQAGYPKKIDSLGKVLDSLKSRSLGDAEIFANTQFDLFQKIHDSIYKAEMSAIRKEFAQKATNTPITKEKFESVLSNWDGSLPSLVDFTKDNLNNPDSFEHVETGYSIKDGYVKVRMIYRGKNAYNALVKGVIIVKTDGNGKLLEIISSD